MSTTVEHFEILDPTELDKRKKKERKTFEQNKMTRRTYVYETIV